MANYLDGMEGGKHNSDNAIASFIPKRKPKIYKAELVEIKCNVWNKTAHIYKSGTGNLCGTPALSTNWAKIEMVDTIGCNECLRRYNESKKLDNIKKDNL